MRRVTSLLLCFSIGACTWFGGDTHVVVTSEPAGAEILVDGTSTGSTTPSKLDFGALLGGDHQVTLRKRGFADETRMVLHHTQAYTSRWVDGADLRTIDFPLWWTLGDFLTPFAVRYEYVPHSLHVILHSPGEVPVHSEIAADR